MYLSVFYPNAGKWGKNADQNNSEYGLFLRRVYHLFPVMSSLSCKSVEICADPPPLQSRKPGEFSKKLSNI